MNRASVCTALTIIVLIGALGLGNPFLTHDETRAAPMTAPVASIVGAGPQVQAPVHTKDITEATLVSHPSWFGPVALPIPSGQRVQPQVHQNVREDLISEARLPTVDSER